MAKIHNAEMQYLTVAFAKSVGKAADGSVETFDSNSCSREEAGLRPLLIYSITAPYYGVRARMLVDAAFPAPITEFLATAWSCAHGIGMPQTLEMEAALLQADTGFVSWCRDHGVLCEPAQSEKSMRALARSAQELAWPITFRAGERCKKASSLAAANSSLRNHDVFAIERAGARNTSMVQMTFEAWLGRGQPFLKGKGVADDWAIDRLKEKPRQLPLPRRIDRDPDSEEYGCEVPGLKEIIEMWPGGRRAFFRGTGVTARDFDYWAVGRGHLFPQEAHDVKWKAGAREKVFPRCWVLRGGNLLVGRTAKGTLTVWKELLCEDDLQYAFEALAPAGMQFAMRVLIMGMAGGKATLILLPRDGGPLEALVDGRSLPCLGEPRQASVDAFEDLLTVVEHCEDYEKPEQIGWEFGDVHRSWLLSGFPVEQFDDA